MSRSRNNTITLVNTTLETSGRYKCEATGASFQEAHLEAYLNITPPGKYQVSIKYITMIDHRLILMSKFDLTKNTSHNFERGHNRGDSNKIIIVVLYDIDN